jgi:uncharacterized SAM-binding protein YcdF (DUF218 family)
MFRMFRFARNAAFLLLLLVLAASGACVAAAGRLIVDPGATATPEPADIIFVLAGGVTADRWLEAYDLWREERAPAILLSRGYMDRAGHELRRRGVHVPDEAEIARDVMVRHLAVPPSAVSLLDVEVDNTADEAQAMGRAALERGWRRVIVVTSLPHTRRTALAMKRALEGSGITVQVRGSRYDGFSPWGWWRTRSGTRWVMAELPKLIAYRLGLGG